MTLEEALQDFILDKELAGLARASIQSYKNFIHVFLLYIDKDLSLQSVSYEVVKRSLVKICSGSIGQATKSTYVRNIRIFLCWIDNEYGLPFNPRKIKIPRRPKRAVMLLNSSEVGNLFSCVKSSIPWITARNNAMIALMYDSGIRQKEVCGLLKKNIDREKMIIKVTGKGAKDRYVPLGKVSLSMIGDYLQLCPYKDSEYLFLGRYGKPVTTGSVKTFMNRLKHQTGFDLSSHKLRHNFATNFCIDSLCETGCSNMSDLSALLGHESVETTKQYEHFAQSMLAAQIRRSHLDKIMM